MCTSYYVKAGYFKSLHFVILIQNSLYNSNIVESMGTTSNSSFISLLFTLYPRIYFLLLVLSRSFVPPSRGGGKKWKDSSKPGVLVGE